jgi:hypothetical protein
MAAQHDSHVKELAEMKCLLNKVGPLPRLMKKVGQFDGFDGIISHVTNGCTTATPISCGVLWPM